MSFRKELKVRFGDIDHAGIVYYPTMVNYTHLAMEDFFDEYLAVRYASVLNDHRLGFPTVRLEMDFRSPLRYGDRIEIQSSLERMGTSSLEWRHSLYLQGESGRPPLVAEARIVTVCMDLETLAKRPIPDWLRRRIEELAGTRGEADLRMGE